jgi:hypothetical protein
LDHADLIVQIGYGLDVDKNISRPEQAVSLEMGFDRFLQAGGSLRLGRSQDNGTRENIGELFDLRADRRVGFSIFPAIVMDRRNVNW